MELMVPLRKLLQRLDTLDAPKVAWLLAALGLVTFFNGLANAFQGDDSYQIVTNLPVHSISHIFQFFGSSTFFNGQRLTGVYYRPLMTTVFSVIYTVFGAHPIAYHIVQLALYIAGSFLFYLVLKHFLRPAVCLALAIVFLVHPMNSQIVYSIPTMQDALFFFFGMLGFWLLINYKDQKAMWWSAACLLLAMLSKESGFVFTAVAGLYLYIFDRDRLVNFAKTMAGPVVLYLVLKINAVGLNTAQHAAPIDNLGLGGRLLTTPSIILFYIIKFIFPWRLASSYYWTNPTFSVRHVLMPLTIDLAVAGFFVYLGWRVRQRLSKKDYRAYLFFSVWTLLGVALYSQFIALDMTVCETWFFFSMAGLLAMIGLAAKSAKLRLQPVWVLVLIIALTGVLAVRSAVRGADYRSQYKLAVSDLRVEPANYSALSNVSQYLIDHGQYRTAAVYAQRSIDVYPVVSNYINLGVAQEQSGQYTDAIKAYQQALKYGDLSIIYENMSLILIVYSNPASASQFLQTSLSHYPNDYKLWLYLAVFEGAIGSENNAKTAIANAAKYGPVPTAIYQNIMAGQPFTLPLLGKTVLVR